MFFLAVLMAVGWALLMGWFGVLINEGNSDRAALVLAGAFVLSAVFTFLNRPKITLDRNPIVERLIDLLFTLIGNLVIAFIAVLIMGRIV